MKRAEFSFWQWFLSGGTRRPGWLRLLDRWLLLHAATGVGLALVVDRTLKDAGATVLLPLTGVLVGLSFAWSGNAVALLQTPEIDRIAQYNRGGIRDYVYTFQLSILVLLATICLWGIAALGVFDRAWPWLLGSSGYRVVAGVLYALTSLAIRECWQVVIAGQWLLILRAKIKEELRSLNAEEPPE